MDFGLKSDLNLWYKFDGNANDSSGNGNNGTVNGATLVADEWGQSNHAYEFDGVNDWIDTNYNFTITGEQSLSFSHKKGADNQVIFWARRDSSGNGYQFDTSASDTRFISAGVSALIQSGNNLNNTDWHHLVFQLDGSNVEFYEDGSFLASQSKPSINNIALSATIGRVYGSSGGVSGYFDGAISEVKIKSLKERKALIEWRYRTRNLRKAI